MDNALPSSPTTRRVMLITGGSRGIGAATAVLAAKAGYAVAINYRDNAQAAAETANAVEAAGGEAWCVQADVDRAGHTNLRQLVVQTHRDPK